MKKSPKPNVDLKKQLSPLKVHIYKTYKYQKLVKPNICVIYSFYTDACVCVCVFVTTLQKHAKEQWDDSYICRNGKWNGILMEYMGDFNFIGNILFPSLCGRNVDAYFIIYIYLKTLYTCSQIVQFTFFAFIPGSLLPNKIFFPKQQNLLN